jgi:hypothetical protein
MKKNKRCREIVLEEHSGAFRADNAHPPQIVRSLVCVLTIECTRIPAAWKARRRRLQFFLGSASAFMGLPAGYVEPSHHAWRTCPARLMECWCTAHDDAYSAPPAVLCACAYSVFLCGTAVPGIHCCVVVVDIIVFLFIQMFALGGPEWGVRHRSGPRGGPRPVPGAHGGARRPGVLAQGVEPRARARRAGPAGRRALPRVRRALLRRRLCFGARRRLPQLEPPDRPCVGVLARLLRPPRAAGQRRAEVRQDRAEFRPEARPRCWNCCW